MRNIYRELKIFLILFQGFIPNLYALLFQPQQGSYNSFNIESILKPDQSYEIPYSLDLESCSSEETPYSLIEQARNDIIPEQFSDTLAAKIDIVNQGPWDPFPNDPQQWIKAIYTFDRNFGSLPVLRIDYDLESYDPKTGRLRPAFNGYAIKINDQDFSEPEIPGYNEKIIFYIKGGDWARGRGYTTRLKLEFKNARGQKGVYIINGITSDWQKIEIDKRDIGGDFAFKSNWSDIKEINLVFEDHTVTNREGTIYLAGFTYPESWQVAETIGNFYHKVNELQPDQAHDILSQVVGPGVEYKFEPEKIGEIKSWIFSSHEKIVEDKGLYALKAMLESSGQRIINFSNLRISSVLSTILSGKSDLEFDYSPSLYSLYRASEINGYNIYAFRLSNLEELQNFFNQTNQKPLVVEFKTGEYLQLTGFNRGGFLWLTKFANLKEDGETIKISEKDFNRLWTGYILSSQVVAGYQPLTNKEIYQHQSRDFILESLIQEAQRLAQEEYHPVEIKPIPVLDPPLDGRPESEGLVYQEYLAIKGDKFYDDGNWWLEARPRGSQNRYPLKLFFYNQDKRGYQEVKYDINNYDYSSPVIQPPIENVPPEGRYITALNLGHILVAKKFPQFFTIGGDGYLRFIPLAEGMQMGASFRVAGHNVTWPRKEGDLKKEDFPIVRKLYVKKISDDWMNLIALIDSEGFTGVLNMRVKPGEKTKMFVDAKFYPRRDILVSEEPDTGFAAFSSMFFLGDAEQGSIHTPWNPHDEAHDSDYLVVRYDDGKVIEFPINRPASPDVYTIDFGRFDARITSFSLQQRDRDPAHYSAFPSADYSNRPSFDLNLIETNIPLKVRLYEIYTDNEYVDNIVVLLAIDRDLHKGEEIDIKYEVVAYEYQD